MEIPLVPDTKNIIVLEGVIKNIDSRLVRIDFMNKPISRKTAARVETFEDVGRVLGAAAGSSISISTPHTPSTHSTRVEFILGEKKIRGWLGRFYFHDGDFVKVVAAKRDDHYECFAVLRPADKIITTYPWSTRGFASFDKRTKIIFGWAIPILLLISIAITLSIVTPDPHVQIKAFSLIFGIGVIIFLVIGMQPERRYCAVAEDIFKSLGWRNPEDINLEKIPAGVKVPEPPGFRRLTLNYFYKDEWCLVQSPDTGPSNEAKVT